MRLLLACLLCWGCRATAEIGTADAQGFTVRHQASVEISPQEAYRVFVEEIDQWWSGDHSYSGDASNLAMDSTCFCETWDQGRVEHLRVVNAQPGRLLRLKGGLGPLQGLPVVGSIDITFSPTDRGTQVSLVYQVVGDGLADWAAPVDSVIGQQIERYARMVNTQE